MNDRLPSPIASPPASQTLAQLASSYFLTALIFLLPALTLNARFGVGLVEVGVLFGLVFHARTLFQQRHATWWPARYVIAVFAFSLVVAAASSLQTGFAWQSLDNPIRQVIAILVIGLVVHAKPKSDWFWYGLFFGAVSAGLFAAYQRFGLNLLRAEGVHMPIMFGDIAIAMALMSLASIARFGKTRYAVLPYIAFAGGLIASLLSGSRGGWAVLALCFIPLYRFGTPGTSRRTVIIAAIGIALLAGAAFIPKLGMQQRFSDVVTDIRLYQTGDPVTSVGARLEMWKGALKLIAAHPVAGVGRANFNHGLTELIAKKELSPSVAIYHHAHNEMLHAMATQGILGGVALLLIYAAPLAFFLAQLRVAGSHQPFALAGVLLGLSFIAFGLTQVMFSHHVGSAFHALATGVLVGLCLLHRQQDDVLRTRAAS